MDGVKEEKHFRLEVVKWEGRLHCCYLNSFRIAGGKPWAGGETVKAWSVPLRDVIKAIPELQKMSSDLTAALAREAALRQNLEFAQEASVAFAEEADATQSELAALREELAEIKESLAYRGSLLNRTEQRLTAAENELAELHGKLELRDGEIWRDVKGYEGKYLVSNIGRVKAMPFDGPGKRNKEVIRWFSTDRYGYRRLNLANKGKKQNFFVHRLVAVAFLPNPDNKPFVNHIDGDKFNNHCSNLEWVSSKENNLHVCRVLKKRVKPVVSVCLESGAETEYPSFKAAHDLGFNRSSIAKCIAGKLESHRGFKWFDAKPTESGASE